MDDSNDDRTTRNQNNNKKQTVIFVKSPNESNYEQDDYTRSFAETNLYLPTFISILKTKSDEGQIDELKSIIEQGPESLDLSGVVITSSRSVDAIQSALNKIKDDLDAEEANNEISNSEQLQQQVKQENKGSNWSSIPFFVIGISTYKNLLNLNNFSNPTIFPNPKSKEINILGHDQSGSGAKLATFIKAYFSGLEKNNKPLEPRQPRVGSNGNNHHDLDQAEPKDNTIRLLYLTGDPHDSGLTENLINHNDNSKNQISFKLIEKIVYSIEPETEPRFEPQYIFNSISNGIERDIEEQEQKKLEKEIQTEINKIQEQQQEQDSKELIHWIVFFSPNSTRIFLNNINNLLVKIKFRFLKLHLQDPDDCKIQTELSIIKEKNVKQFNFYENLLKLNLIKIAAIGPTTANFICENFNFKPNVVSPKPNSSILLKSILDYDHPSLP